MQQSYAKRAAARGSQLLVQRALIFKAQWIPKSKIAFSVFLASFYLPNRPPGQ